MESKGKCNTCKLKEPLKSKSKGSLKHLNDKGIFKSETEGNRKSEIKGEFKSKCKGK